METAEQRFRQLVEDATADPAVLGLVVTGSRGKGFGSASSDFDLLLVVRDGEDAAGARYLAEAVDGVDLRAMSLSRFAGYAAWGTAFAWDRYSFAHAAVPVDKTGEVRRLADEKGGVPSEHRGALLREALDAYVNGVYRSLKCLRNGNTLGARLEAAESIGYALTVIFALEGRTRPYHGYLERELRAFPLRSLPIGPDELLGLIRAIMENADAPPQRRLLVVIDRLGRAAGHGDVFEAWGPSYDWMMGVDASPPG